MFKPNGFVFPMQKKQHKTDVQNCHIKLQEVMLCAGQEGLVASRVEGVKTTVEELATVEDEIKKIREYHFLAEEKLEN